MQKDEMFRLCCTYGGAEDCECQQHCGLYVWGKGEYNLRDLAVSGRRIIRKCILRKKCVI